MGILDEFDEAATQFPSAVGFIAGVIHAHPKKAAGVYRRLLDERLELGEEEDDEEEQEEERQAAEKAHTSVASKVVSSPRPVRAAQAAVDEEKNGDARSGSGANTKEGDEEAGSEEDDDEERDLFDTDAAVLPVLSTEEVPLPVCFFARRDVDV